MYHYQKNIGDYRSATMHLSLLEHGVYNQLLDWYYLDEQPLPTDNRTLFRRLSARTETEQQAVIDVLSEMFFQSESGWMHKRVEREITQYKAKADQARAAGKLGGRPPKKGIGFTENRDGFQKEPDAKPTANREPLTTNHEPVDKESTSAAKLPTCKASAVIDLYHEILPELPSVRLETADRKRAIRKLWQWVLTSRKSDGTRRAESSEDALQWVRGYFARARENDFLMGRIARGNEHANWRCDLDFLLSDKGMKHVIEKTLEQA